MDQQHHVYRPDSTKLGKMIAMLMAGRLLGPDWSRYAIHHYDIENNAVQGVSRIQLQSEHATRPQAGRVYLQVVEPGGVVRSSSKVGLRIKVNTDLGEQVVWSLTTDADQILTQDLVERLFRMLRYVDKDGNFMGAYEDVFGVVHPDNRVTL